MRSLRSNPRLFAAKWVNVRVLLLLLYTSLFKCANEKGLFRFFDHICVDLNPTSSFSDHFREDLRSVSLQCILLVKILSLHLFDLSLFNLRRVSVAPVFL